ncbi:hypothetical protein, partial [Escherichia coli]|uniref:hypothetical protein n=1 Tax=Escherichia coli TaxID=562 RepID=UPI001BDDC412
FPGRFRLGFKAATARSRQRNQIRVNTGSLQTLAIKQKPRSVPAAGVFCFHTLKGARREPVFDFSKLIREIRVMAEKLSTWKFLLIWLVFLILASGYFVGQIRWW